MYLKTHTLILISQVYCDLNNVWFYFLNKSIEFRVSHLCGAICNENTSETEDKVYLTINIKSQKI